MSLLYFTDPDGDPLAVDALAIVAVSVGRLMDYPSARRLRPVGTAGVDADTPVTLLHTPAGPLLVSEPYDVVIRRWKAVVGVVPTEVSDAPGR
jgi:hypothetical protein